jgi:hypothetical protein
MGHTEADLDRMINEVLDERKQCHELPYICGLLHVPRRRQRLFEVIKKMVLEQGETDIESILAQIEASHDFRY